MSSPDDPPISSIATAFKILDVLGERECAGPTEIAEVLDVSQSTVHRHLVTLVDVGIVRKKGAEYRVSMRLLEQGAKARLQYEFYPLAKPVVDDLVRRTNEAAAIAVAEGHLTYIYQSRCQQEMKYDLSLGQPYADFHCSAAGKALLAAMPPERAHEVLDRQGLPQCTPNTITDRDALFDELARVRERGVALDDEERLDGVRAVGTTIENRESGETLGAISVFGPSIRFDGETFREELPTVIERTASLVELNLRYQNDSSP